ncbi:class F sortase [Kitasatospora sp. NPDC089797]|uniref:class F sortase n=1 Tax=Kitasatospora sp. NPDC089797 TaxID=3155298 RepID=UPI00342E82C9
MPPAAGTHEQSRTDLGGRGRDRRGRDARGQDGHGPDRRGQDGRGQDGRGQDRRGRRRAAPRGPSILQRTVFGTAGLLCLALGASLALSGRDTPVVRIETSGHDPAATPPTAGAPGSTSGGTSGGTAPGGAPTAATRPLAASPPTRLQIPTIGVDAPVIELGLNTDGTVQVPSADHADQVGWYRNGPTPGQSGPSVLIGHLDTKHGPAVFQRLPELHPGDLIRVARADGGTVNFKVRTLLQAAKDQFPTDTVYGDTPGPALRLITCGGRIGPDGHWTDNIIVLADPA